MKKLSPLIIFLFVLHAAYCQNNFEGSITLAGYQGKDSGFLKSFYSHGFQKQISWTLLQNGDKKMDEKYIFILFVKTLLINSSITVILDKLPIAIKKHKKVSSKK